MGRVRRVRRVQRGVPGRGAGRPSSAGKTVDEAIAGLTLPEKFKDYGMQGAKDNVAKIYAELKPMPPSNVSTAG